MTIASMTTAEPCRLRVDSDHQSLHLITRTSNTIHGPCHVPYPVYMSPVSSARIPPCVLHASQRNSCLPPPSRGHRLCSPSIEGVSAVRVPHIPRQFSSYSSVKMRYPNHDTLPHKHHASASHLATHSLVSGRPQAFIFQASMQRAARRQLRRKLSRYLYRRIRRPPLRQATCPRPQCPPPAKGRRGASPTGCVYMAWVSLEYRGASLAGASLRGRGGSFLGHACTWAHAFPSLESERGSRDGDPAATRPPPYPCRGSVRLGNDGCRGFRISGLKHSSPARQGRCRCDPWSMTRAPRGAMLLASSGAFL